MEAWIKMEAHKDAVVLIALSVISVATAYTPEALADQITNLPGAEQLALTFKQFSGYLDIPGTNGAKTKHMHYWFVESMNKPASDPLAFWTNGGPGCSGLIGFMTEQGPFRPNADNTLHLNEYAWNKIANMVFIESPAGVGYSYSDNKDDLKIGDAQTALDNYNLINAFLTRFPEYATNPLYTTSESYGGHYMPTLAKQIVDANKNATNKLNYKGFAVGNPMTNAYSATGSQMDTYYGHQLVSQPMYEDYVAACGQLDTLLPSTACEVQIARMMKAIGDLNAYALDYPICTEGAPSQQAIWQMNHVLRAQGFNPKAMGLKGTEAYEPCLEDYSSAYLNQESVKKALHVNSDLSWEMCSSTLQYEMKDAMTSTAPIYNYLIDGKFGLDILVYSGDDDAVCSTLGTQAWIWKLGYKAAVSWAVDTLNGQTVGYLSKWKDTKLGFLTVHAAGHEVPTYKPEVAFSLWKRYLAGELTDK